MVKKSSKAAGSKDRKGDVVIEDPGQVYGPLGQAVTNHVNSFNAFLDDKLEEIQKAVEGIEVDAQDPGGKTVNVKLTELQIYNPMNKTGEGQQLQRKWLPRDCRLAHSSYLGTLTGKFVCTVGNDPRMHEATVELGQVPIMVGSKKCNLHGMTPKQLVAHGEDETEAGGYFLMRGLERVVRVLIMPRANFPMGVIRSSYKNRGYLYSEYAVTMRCMRPDGTCLTNSLHYCTDGSCFLRFSHSREEWLIPLVLAAKCCFPVSDRMLLELMTGGAGVGASEGGNTSQSTSQHLLECMLVMMQQQSAKKVLATQTDAREYLASIFRVVIGKDVPSRFTDEEVGEYIVNRFFMGHASEGFQKLLTLCIMYQKLIALVRGDIEQDNQDCMAAHDVLSPGILYGMVLKESLEVMMQRMRMVIRKFTWSRGDQKPKYKPEDFVNNASLLSQTCKISSEISTRIANFLATGNVTSRSGLDLMQTSGFTIMADKLNQARFSSHFASVHRGQYFAEMKTTTVRKLLPETWGFLCPVHTPDGSPCGLLNHFADPCRPVHRMPLAREAAAVKAVLAGVGAVLLDDSGQACTGPPPGGKHVWILLDGKPLGFIDAARLDHAERSLRDAKVSGDLGVPKDLEVVNIPLSWSRLFSGLFLFMGPGRLTRPVKCLRTGKEELVGPLEQIFLHVSVLSEERRYAHSVLELEDKKDTTALANLGLPEQLPITYTHEEIKPTNIFSTLAAFTPYSNHNQSPRNMYQCQMLKQTMGTPYHNHEYRADNKVFRVLHPQKPMIRTDLYNKRGLDLHPTGTNAVVAVITYTGYDMEDAMIINKSSYERGFKHGVVYKTKVIDSNPDAGRFRRSDPGNAYFINPGMKYEGLDASGFPPIGTFMQKDMPLYSYIDTNGDAHMEKYKDDEPGYVEALYFVEGKEVAGGAPCKRAMLRMRYPRNPIVGDKFASRHGQKGVMSFLWPQEDMPFTDGGITPDILFNPHGFPSRMTIGMLIESMAGKACASEGRTRADATTFREYQGHYCDDDENEGNPFPQHDDKEQWEKAQKKAADLGGYVRVEPKAHDYFGKALVKHGFQRLGTDRMYSGIHGTEMETEIFCGVVYYQRLRHLVSDKAQVRARGANDMLLGQPVKGRKRHGGIRFGEMERDSLLAHGCSYLLHDRLMRCSDYDIAYVCPKCHSILTPQANPQAQVGDKSVHKAELGAREGDTWVCPPCTRKHKRVVRCLQMPVPIVLRYLVAELAAMNINMQIRVKDQGREASLSQLGTA